MDLNNAHRSLSGYLDELSHVPKQLEQLCCFINVEGKTLYGEVANQIRHSQEVFVFGMASSQWASWPMVLGLTDLGIKIHWKSAYEGLQISSTCFSKRSLVILVSQSGETIEIRRLLEQIRKCPDKPLVLGVTNSPTSSLAVGADLVIDIFAGQELHAPSKTYVNTLAALVILYSFVVENGSKKTEELVGFLSEVASHIDSHYEAWKNWGEKVAGSLFKHGSPIQFLAIGPQMASAWQSSMLCSETARSFSAVWDWATFRHGFEPQVDKSFVAIGFKPTKHGTEVWNTASQSILNRNGQVFLIPSLIFDNMAKFYKQEIHGMDIISPIWETLPIHWFCIDLARRKELDASQIERKVTLNL